MKLMKKSIVVLLASVIAGVGIGGLVLAKVGVGAQRQEAIARYVDEVACRGTNPDPKQADQFRTRDLPHLRAVLAKEDGPFEQAYLWVCWVLPDYVKARLPEIYPSGMIRLNAAAVVGRWGQLAKDAVPELVRLLRDDVADSNAALSLGQIGPDAREAIPALITAVEEQRPMAATALGMMGPTAGVARPILREVAANGPEWQRREVRLALRRIGENLSVQN
jgi:hypothetical protein